MMGDNLQDINLALMRLKAKQAGVNLADLAAIDVFANDPSAYNEQELWNDQIHDSHLYSETYILPETVRRVWRAVMDYGNPYESYGRTERDMYFPNGEHVTLTAEQLERLWRAQNGYKEVIKESTDEAGVNK